MALAPGPEDEQRPSTVCFRRSQIWGQWPRQKVEHVQAPSARDGKSFVEQPGKGVDLTVDSHCSYAPAGGHFPDLYGPVLAAYSQPRAGRHLAGHRLDIAVNGPTFLAGGRVPDPH